MFRTNGEAVGLFTAFATIETRGFCQIPRGPILRKHIVLCHIGDQLSLRLQRFHIREQSRIPALSRCTVSMSPGVNVSIWMCIYSHIHGSGACSGGLYMAYTAYTAIYTIYRAVGQALGVCICHIQHIQPYKGQWGHLWESVYAIYSHIHHIQGSGASSGVLYMPYTPYTGQWCLLWGLYMPYTPYTGQWGLLWGLYIPYTAIYTI